MKKVIGIFLVLFFSTVGILPAEAVFGNYGDLMLLYAPAPIDDPIGAKAEREARDYIEALLLMQIPQYAMEDQIRNEALIRGEFFYHTEICDASREYKDCWGMTWRRYRFTDLALQMSEIGQVVAIHNWIVVNNAWRYKLPLDEVRQLYTRYARGEFIVGKVPIELMIGTEYGQSVEEYTDFVHFYSVFMNKHHYCITACFWAVLKSMYDCGDAAYKQEVENTLKDPQVVQSHDALPAGELIGMLLRWRLIEEY